MTTVVQLDLLGCSKADKKAVWTVDQMVVSMAGQMVGMWVVWKADQLAVEMVDMTVAKWADGKAGLLVVALVGLKAVLTADQKAVQLAKWAQMTVDWWDL